MPQRLLLAMGVVTCVMTALAVPSDDVLPIPIGPPGDPAWNLQATGHHRAWIDRRQLIVFEHPLSASVHDTGAWAETTFSVPESYSGPLEIHFYMTDTYDGLGQREEKDWLGEEDFRGQITLPEHRFKQAFVDGQLVWEIDIADSAGPNAQKRFVISLPEGLTPGDHVLAIRVWDKIASDTHRDGDKRHIGQQEVGAISADDPWVFPSTVYFGDVAVTMQGVAFEPARRAPVAALVEARHTERWPVAPRSEPQRFPVILDVKGAAVNDAPRVLQCGIPFPMGTLNDSMAVQVTAEGDPLPVQTTPMNHWPDGSVRWMQLDTILPPNTARVRLNVLTKDDGTPPPSLPVTVQRDDSGVSLMTGDVHVVCGSPGAPLSLHLQNGAAHLRDIQGSLNIAGTRVQPLVDEIVTLSEGPLRAEIELRGTLQAGEERKGRFAFRVAAFAGQPFIRATWRIINDTPETLQVSSWDVTGNASLAAPFTSMTGNGTATTADAVAVHQHDEAEYTLSAANGNDPVKGEFASGFLGVTAGDGAMLVAVRHFAEQFPKSLAFDKGAFRIGLFDSSEALPLYEPHEGEAKRHEFWIGLWDASCDPQTLEQHAANWKHPAHLFDPTYVCATGAMGEAFPHDDTRFPELTALMDLRHREDAQTNSPERAEAASGYGIRRGIRHWGDSPYGTSHWCNGYYDRQQGFAVEYLMTGGAEWFQRLEATVLHIIDVDICHYSSENSWWVGGIHGLYAEDHSTGGVASAPWMPGQRTKGTLAYWRYTADDLARDAALGVADAAIRSDWAIGASSVRDHGGVLYALMAAYDETGEKKYLDQARKVAHDSFRCIDPRRGTYEEIHGNVNLYGGVPWLMAQLAEPLYEYYRHSGDVEAAIAVTTMAEALMAESAQQDDPATFYGYSFNPVFRARPSRVNLYSHYNVLVAPMFMYAYDLTGEQDFLDFGRGLYNQTIADGTVSSVTNCYWNTETLLYFLNAFARN